ncbi:MAG: DUF6111 family protein [Micropepsaceae bacterium]
MIRRLLLDIVLFLLPFFLYGVYWRAIGRAASAGKERVHPWTALTAAGLLLVILSFVWWRLSSGDDPEGLYVPPHLENGEVVPGHFAPDQSVPTPEQLTPQ